MGDEENYDNARWIRENRYVLEAVRNEDLKCEKLFGTEKRAYLFGYIPIEYDSVQWWSPWWVKCLTHEPFSQSLCKFTTNFPEYIKIKKE